MIDYILQMTLSNLLVALALAIVALVLQRRYRANALANVVWVMVLLKLLTPPLVSLPLVEVESLVNSAEATLSHSVVAEAGGLADAVISDAAELSLLNANPEEKEPAGNGGIISSQAIVSLGVVWIGVTALLLVVSLFRIIRFHLQIHRQAKIRSNPGSGNWAIRLPRHLVYRKCSHCGAARKYFAIRMVGGGQAADLFISIGD
jgi:beta-lactamase regulating signal transducer with metallopeptidase domain